MPCLQLYSENTASFSLATPALLLQQAVLYLSTPAHSITQARGLGATVHQRPWPPFSVRLCAVGNHGPSLGSRRDLDTRGPARQGGYAQAAAAAAPLVMGTAQLSGGAACGAETAGTASGRASVAAARAGS